MHLKKELEMIEILFRLWGWLTTRAADPVSPEDDRELENMPLNPDA